MTELLTGLGLDPPLGAGLTLRGMDQRDTLLSIGLLRPAHVDGWTAHRYYDPEQLQGAVAIRRLRQLDVPLDGIARMLHADDRDLMEIDVVDVPALRLAASVRQRPCRRPARGAARTTRVAGRVRATTLTRCPPPRSTG